jgi:hypothetical protein
VEKPLTKQLGIPRNRLEITLSWILGKRLWDGSEQQNLAQSLRIRPLEINDSATKTDLIAILETRPISIKNHSN